MRIAIVAVLAACGGSRPAPPERMPAPAPRPIAIDAAMPVDAVACTPLPGEPSATSGAYAMFHDEHAVTLYRVDADCASLVATIDARGRIAIVELVDAPGMPAVVVDTWLMHGDRLRRRYTWTNDAYAEGPDEEIPGPDKFRRRK